MLCATTIKELQNIIKEDYGKELTIEQSADVANTLVQYFDLLAKIKYGYTEPLNAKNKCHEK